MEASSKRAILPSSLYDSHIGWSEYLVRLSWTRTRWWGSIVPTQVCELDFAVISIALWQVIYLLLLHISGSLCMDASAPFLA